MKKKKMKDESPLMVDAEVTVRILLKDFCWYSDIEGDNEELRRLVQEKFELDGIEVEDEDDFVVIEARAIV